MLSTACPKQSPKPPRSRRPLKKSGRPKAVNRKRRARLFREDFGSKEYVEYLHSRPCDICGMEAGFTEAAHTKARGAGGKCDDLVSLCGNRYAKTFLKNARGENYNAPVIGCHQLYDTHDPEARSHELRLRTLAKRLYADFQSRTTNRDLR